MESRLKAERLKRNLSQSRIAEIAGVDTVTVSRWERGQSIPSKEPLQKLCEFLGLSAKELGFDGDPLLPQNTAFQGLSQDPVTRLSGLASLPLCRYERTYRLVRKTSEEVMKLYSSRRDMLKGVLGSLVTLPVSSIRNGAHWEVILQQCTVAIAVCQEFSASTDADDLRLAFNRVSAYLEIVAAIARDSSRLREKALNLAANAAILKTELGWSNKDLMAVIQYAQEAVVYSDEYYRATGDISTLLSARSKLAWVYYDAYGNKNTLALSTAEKSQYLLEHAHQEVHPCLLGGTHSTLALMQANQGINADKALGKATELDPGDEVIAMMDFTRARLPLEKALILCHMDQPEQARKSAEEQIDPETLIQKRPDSGWGRLEAIYLLTLTSLKSKERDMDEIIHFWTAGIEGAKASQSEFRFAQSVNLYQQMKLVWPGEQRIKDLRSFAVHW